jgi:DNA-binding XRE family transcriptional regulator
MFRGIDLLALRERRGLSQAAVCRRAGLSRSALSKLESGRSVPTIETAVEAGELDETSACRVPARCGAAAQVGAHRKRRNCDTGCPLPFAFVAGVLLAGVPHERRRDRDSMASTAVGISEDARIRSESDPAGITT